MQEESSKGLENYMEIKEQPTESMVKKIKKTRRHVKSLENYKEIKKQLAELRVKKASIEKNLEEIKNNSAVNQDNEFEVMNEVTKKANELMGSVNTLTGMIKNGVSLNKKRFEIEKELSDIKERIEKLEKIHAELSEVWK